VLVTAASAKLGSPFRGSGPKPVLVMTIRTRVPVGVLAPETWGSVLALEFCGSWFRPDQEDGPGWPGMEGIF